MKRSMYIVSLCIILVIGLVGCKSQEEDVALCREQYFMKLLDGDVAVTASNGLDASYYYNLDGKYRIKLQLEIKHQDQVVQTIEVQKDKNDNHIIDGTFGISAKRNMDKNTILWTIRQDEEIAQATTEDFFADVIGEDNHISTGGLIYEVGVSPATFNYKLTESEEQNPDWTVIVKLYGNKLEQ